MLGILDHLPGVSAVIRYAERFWRAFKLNFIRRRSASPYSALRVRFCLRQASNSLGSRLTMSLPDMP